MKMSGLEGEQSGMILALMQDIGTSLGFGKPFPSADLERGPPK